MAVVRRFTYFVVPVSITGLIRTVTNFCLYT